MEVDAAKEAAEAANAARGAAVEELEKLRRQLEKQAPPTPAITNGDVLLTCSSSL